MTTSRHSNYKLTTHQQNLISNQQNKLDAFGFFNLLTCDQLFDQVESLLPPHRERLFPPTETLSLFLSQAVSADRSCQGTVDQFAITQLVNGLPSCSTHTGGYCRARQRLSIEMVRESARFTGGKISQLVQDKWHWQGRAVKIVDGTTVTLPDTSANQAVYPQMATQKPGLGHPICKLVGITCLSSGALLDAAMCRVGGKGNDEQSLLRTLLNTLETNDILLGDAYYATYFLLAELQRRGIDGVFEQYGARKRSTDFRRGIRLGTKDHLIEITKPTSPPGWMSSLEYASIPSTLTVRELRVKGKTLVTTLCCATTTPKVKLWDLYKRRWNIELDLRHIKSTMGMGALSCRTPEMAEKEIWVYLLAYNLIRLILIQSALLCDVIPRLLSFKHAVQLWTSFTQQASLREITIDELEHFLTLVAQKRVGNRPGRIEPRALKGRGKPYPLLKVPRPAARMEISRKWA